MAVARSGRVGCAVESQARVVLGGWNVARGLICSGMVVSWLKFGGEILHNEWVVVLIVVNCGVQFEMWSTTLRFFGWGIFYIREI